METHYGLAPHPRFAAGARYWRRILIRLFELPGAEAFPPLTIRPTPAERDVIERYLRQTAFLTQSEGLNGASGVRNSLTRDDEWKWTVESNFPVYEARAGLAAQFRQLYSTSGQRASFQAVINILRRLSADGSEDEARRIELLDLWGKANRALRSKSARRLANEKIGGPYSDASPSPDQIINLFGNAEHFHWAEDKVARLDARRPSPQSEANLQHRYHEAVAPLAHLFIYFADFVRKVIEPSGTRAQP
jgi:hypothetical protein